MAILLGARTFFQIICQRQIFFCFSFEIGLFKNFHFKSKKSPPTPILCIKIKEFYWFWAYFVIALQIFTKFFQKLFLVIIVFKHYTLRKQCDFLLLIYVLTIINCQNRDVFNHFIRNFSTVKGFNENPHFTTKMKIYRKYVWYILKY